MMTQAKITAGFGAALAGIGFAVPAEAAIVDLTISDATISFFASIDGGDILSLAAPSLGAVVSIYQENNSSDRDLSLFSSGAAGAALARAQDSGLVSGSSFQFSAAINFGANKTGEQYFGFRSAGGLFGWFLVDFGTQGGPIIYQRGAIETMGNPIQIGATSATNVVPLPATLPLAGLGVLALGAAGLRRKRGKAAA